MIPANLGTLTQDFTVTEAPTHTYAMDLETGQIRGTVDGQEAMKQAIFKILMTERYQYVMYSWNYGVELMDLYGEPVDYVCAELERRITEALTWDTRITRVYDFEFEFPQKGVVHVTFKCDTIFGVIEEETEVNF